MAFIHQPYGPGLWEIALALKGRSFGLAPAASRLTINISSLYTRMVIAFRCSGGAPLRYEVSQRLATPNSTMPLHESFDSQNIKRGNAKEPALVFQSRFLARISAVADNG